MATNLHDFFKSAKQFFLLNFIVCPTLPPERLYQKFSLLKIIIAPSDSNRNLKGVLIFSDLRLSQKYKFP